MEHAFWHHKWKTNDIGFHQEQINPMLKRHLGKLGLTQGDRIFVPLCGKTRDTHWLLEQGFKVAGVELNETAVQQLFTDMQLNPQISAAGSLKLYQAPGIDVFVGDFFALTPALLGQVDGIFDRAALVALPKAMRDDYTKHLMHLSAQASQLLLCFDYDPAHMDGPPFSVPPEEVKQHYSKDYHLELVEQFAVDGGLKGICPAEEQVWVLTRHTPEPGN